MGKLTTQELMNVKYAIESANVDHIRKAVDLFFGKKHSEIST